VTVRVAPAGSIIFERGKRIGVDVVQVNVEPGGKKNLVALRDGYLPRRFSIDGSLNSVSITLRAGLPAAGEVVPASEAAFPAPGAPAPAVGPIPPRPAAAPGKAPGATGKKEVFDPSRDVGSL
jgi:hypothetical protein